MSGLDLTAAVEAAARATWEEFVGATVGSPAAIPWEDLTDVQRHSIRETALPFVAAVAPVIEKQVREAVALRIEGIVTHLDGKPRWPGTIVVLAAGIAREATS